MTIKKQVTELNGNGKIVSDGFGNTEVFVPHDGKTIAFQLPVLPINSDPNMPPNNPSSYEFAMKSVDREGLRPTISQLVSFFDILIRNKKNKTCEDLLENHGKYHSPQYFSGTERIGFKDGIFVFDNVDGHMPKTVRELARLWRAGDQRVRCIERGYETGPMNIESFLQNPYTKAVLGRTSLHELEMILRNTPLPSNLDVMQEFTYTPEIEKDEKAHPIALSLRFFYFDWTDSFEFGLPGRNGCSIPVRTIVREREYSFPSNNKKEGKKVKIGKSPRYDIVAEYSRLP